VALPGINNLHVINTLISSTPVASTNISFIINLLLTKPKRPVGAHRFWEAAPPLLLLLPSGIAFRYRNIVVAGISASTLEGFPPTLKAVR
jgi:hypothetical protein